MLLIESPHREVNDVGLASGEQYSFFGVLAIVVGLQACSPTKKADTSPIVQAAEAQDSGVDEPVANSYSPVTQTPRWSAAEVEAELGAHLPSAVPNLAQLRDIYLWIMGNGDEHCPGSTTQLIAVDPELGCTSEHGFWYFGVASYEVYEDETLAGWVVSGDFELETPEEERLSCGGHVGIDDLSDGGARTGTLLGSWRWSGSEDTLATPISASLVIEHALSASGTEVESCRLQGGLTTAAGSWSFDEFQVSADCSDGPTGKVRLYDSARGHWYLVALDDDCSGCGLVQFGDGTELGRICPDWTGLFSNLSGALGPT